MKMQSAEADRNEMDRGYRAMAWGDLLIFITLGFNQGTIGKLLMRMQSVEADCNEMDGGYRDAWGDLLVFIAFGFNQGQYW